MSAETEEKSAGMDSRTKGTDRCFRVTITETLRRTVTVRESELKEPSASEAEQTVSDWWRTGQIVLMEDDFANVEFMAEECGDGDP